MPAPVPVLGYRSKSQAIAALHASGLSYAEIGEKLGMTAKAVYNISGQARSFHSRQLEAARSGGRIASEERAPRRRAAHRADDGYAPEGPLTYAERKPSSLTDEVREKAAQREATRPVGQRRCLLQRGDGAWLGEDGMNFTTNRDKAGRWTPAEIARMRAHNPAKKALTMELA